MKCRKVTYDRTRCEAFAVKSRDYDPIISSNIFEYFIARSLALLYCSLVRLPLSHPLL